MTIKRYSPEQVIIYLRVAEVLLANHSTIVQFAKKIGVTDKVGQFSGTGQ